MPFETRESQVFGEIKSNIPEKANHIARFTIQQHDAKRAGEHYDYRLVLDGKAYSWASKYLLPKMTTERFFIKRQPDHKAEYATWQGTIPEGQYGAGKVTFIFDAEVIVVKSSDNNIKISIPDGGMAGVYSFINKSGDDWIVVRNRELTYDWQDRDSYKTNVKDSLWEDQDYIASEKKDGAHVIAKVTAEKGLGIVSLRKNKKDGGFIVKDNQVPHLAYAKSPKKFDGMVLRGELYLDKYPFSVLSGILNSKSPKAVKAQENLDERIKLAPFEIIKLPGGKDPEDMDYENRLKLLQDFAKEIASDEVIVPDYTTTDKKEFYENIIAKGGEGIVLRHKTDPEFYKIKKEETYTLRIVDYTEGEGRFYKNGIGAFVVEDGKGRRVGKVGTGMSDQMRIHAYNNFNQYRGKLIKVKMMEPTKQSIRSPVFIGWDTDKNEPDIMPF